MQIRKAWPAVVGWLLLLMAGCDSRPTRVPVSGQVLIDGKPLEYGAVIFVPDNGRSSSGSLDKDGHFSLMCFEPNDGALVGTHQVRVIGGKPINDDTTQWFAPKKYSELKTSGLTQEITGPTDSIVFNLTWQGDEHGKPYIEKISTGRGNGPRSPRE